MSDSTCFAQRLSVEQVEEGTELAPKFDQDGLLPVVTTDAASGQVLMLGYMNAEALARTIASGEAHYWSRSRNALWHKGATSGLVQKVIEMRVDDDQDAIWLSVAVAPCQPALNPSPILSLSSVKTAKSLIPKTSTATRPTRPSSRPAKML